MNVLVFGAGGVIGQHMMLCKPDQVHATFYRSQPDMLFDGFDLTNPIALDACLEGNHPDVIINLAGENRPDRVSDSPEDCWILNVQRPWDLANWCHENGSRYIHISTQAVFSGTNPPYGPDSPLDPINLYGRQKADAEARVRSVPGGWTIVRPTFVLGVRPIPTVGRENPAEQMISLKKQVQTNDRWFSVCFADELAIDLWRIALDSSTNAKVFHFGSGRFNRAQLSTMLNPSASLYETSQDGFLGAPRPIDTTYGYGPGVRSPLFPFDSVGFKCAFARCQERFQWRQAITLEQRACEISLFTGMREDLCLAKLRRGFHELHAEVAKDYRAANPVSDWEILGWYRTTYAYIWELSAYHADARFNYQGMCDGIAERLNPDHNRRLCPKRVLCLGDGIGDLTLTLRRAGLDADYHDLANSRTAIFAGARLGMYLGSAAMPGLVVNHGWEPHFRPSEYDAVISFDFLEHVTDVPMWVKAIQSTLKPGGLFFAQNAFACGSGPEGSIPMHLERNDRFEKDWDPMLCDLGFIQESSNWYRTTAKMEVSA